VQLALRQRKVLVSFNMMLAKLVSLKQGLLVKKCVGYCSRMCAAGGPALQAQMAALGLSGPEAQQEYVAQQEQSPAFQALARQQEEALLQNASATGGLRGGNVQGALAQFRPALLNQFP
jgi:hypothetical protein